MKKALLITVVLVITATSVFALVACAPTDPNAFYDALKNADEFTVYSYDADGNESIVMSLNKKGEFCINAMSIYALKEGDKIALYMDAPVVGWTKTTVSVDSEAYKKYMEQLKNNKDIEDKNETYVKEENGFWFVKNDVIKSIGVKMEGGKLVIYTKVGDDYIKTAAMSLKANIKLPDAAKDAKEIKL